MRDTSIMLNEIMVLLYMMTEWLDWMKLGGGRRGAVSAARAPSARESRWPALAAPIGGRPPLHSPRRPHRACVLMEVSDIRKAGRAGGAPGPAAPAAPARRGAARPDRRAQARRARARRPDG